MIATTLTYPIDMTRKHPAQNLLGRRFVRLLVIDRVRLDKPGNSRHNQAAWKCLCDCGKIKYVYATALLKKYTRSCSCYRNENPPIKKPRGEAMFKTLLYHYKKDAAKRGYQWELTESEARKLFKSNCYYCGTEPRNSYGGGSKKTHNGNYIYNGIDRKHNSKGYSLSNCLPCCKWCNHAKSTHSYRAFRAWIKRVIKYHSKENLT